MKQCSKCKIILDESKFGKSKTYSDGLNTICKKCNKLKSNAYFKTKNGIVTAIYAHQKSHSIEKGRPVPTYTKEWLKEWMHSNEDFNKLFDEWVISGYDRWLKPSIDRKDSRLPYTEDNIELMSWKDNFKNARNDSKIGIISSNRKIKSIIQMDTEGKIVNRFISINEAERKTGISKGNICQVCTGKRKKASGFLWSYENE